LIHTFGTGHSHLLAEEIYSRAGGLLPINVVQSAPLMLHEDAVASGDWERQSGLAAILLEHAAVDPSRDALIIISNSGRNAVPVEAAEVGTLLQSASDRLDLACALAVAAIPGALGQAAVRGCRRRSRQSWPTG
jgi:hypothetical protein